MEEKPKLGKADIVTMYKIVVRLGSYFSKVCPDENPDEDKRTPDFPPCYIAKNAICSAAEMGEISYEMAKDILGQDRTDILQKIREGTESITNKKAKCLECYKQNKMEDIQKRLDLK